jgi:hypothetical protein
MITLLVREFTVNLGLHQAWDHLARIEDWPRWARHIRKIDLQPPGELGPQSTGVIHLTNGIQSAFRMTEFNPPRSDPAGGLRSDSAGGLRNWKWVGPILWLTITYDHQFEVLDAEHTRLIWTVAAEGLGTSIFGRLFAMIYRGNMDRAISLLIRELNASPASVRA